MVAGFAWINVMKPLKLVDVLCTSPASTSVCMSVEQRTRVRQTSGKLEQAKLLERQDSQIPETKRFHEPVRAGDHHLHPSAKHIWDQQKPSERSRNRMRNHNGSTSNNRLAAPGSFDQQLSTVLPLQPSVEPPQSSSSNEVVVMRVSLHCQGCAGKVRKHISKMQGVTSFNIDLEKKRVTVIGDVSPLGVLESVSKVKNAEFWPASNSI